ncbi:hypothetical protein COO91_04727 [Nostoc flagelliforme CCNUN1]|uniref:Uncharacterized protein n=1 Tax=Nostoc flagelliforme CCNUN1 TaxID=2038116 RepID=A0A2K8STF6_9NOSO|nr:hypothetical protein COO91_04727 [Nostoc flagelliforme CCNUN1]
MISTNGAPKGITTNSLKIQNLKWYKAASEASSAKNHRYSQR